VAKRKKEKTGSEPLFHVGDRVRFIWGVTPVVGQIVEDRGPIGVGGRRLYRVEVHEDPYFHLVTEMPAVEFERVE
jgi:hypothetical protein